MVTTLPIESLWEHKHQSAYREMVFQNEPHTDKKNHYKCMKQFAIITMK